MSAAMVGCLVAVGVVSTFIFAVSRRMERRRAGWGSQRRPIASSHDDGGLGASSDGWSFAGWFSGAKTIEPGHHGSGHHSDGCTVSDSGASGGWDSGGDCGGGDGGGGGNSD
jgi:hypothetical protein